MADTKPATESKPVATTETTKPQTPDAKAAADAVGAKEKAADEARAAEAAKAVADKAAAEKAADEARRHDEDDRAKRERPAWRRDLAVASLGRVVLYAFMGPKGIVERPARIVSVDNETVNLVVDLDGPTDRPLLDQHEVSYAHISQVSVWRKAVPMNEDPDTGPSAKTWRFPPRF